MNDDLIRRQAAIEAFAPYAEYESNRTNAEWVRRINMVLSALPSAQLAQDLPKGCTDMISRQAALDIYDDYNIAVENGELESYRKYRKQMLALPSAQPTGHWIEDETSNHVEKTFLCSECGFSAWGQYEKTKFCGGCGAKMENPYEEYSEGEQG